MQLQELGDRSTIVGLLFSVWGGGKELDRRDKGSDCSDIVEGEMRSESTQSKSVKSEQCRDEKKKGIDRGRNGERGRT